MNEKKNRCERCQEILKPGNEVWLELDQRTNTYTDLEVPQEHSQGGFPFGADCAKRAITEHKQKGKNEAK
jgi:hypothetical protein